MTARVQCLRILYATHNYPRFPGDPAGAFVARLAQGAGAAGHEVHVVAPHAPGTAAAEYHRGVSLRRFRYAPERLELVGYRGDLHRAAVASPIVLLGVPPFLFAFRRALRRVVRELKPDVIHAHWWLPAGWLAARAGVPYIVTCHGSDASGIYRPRPGSGGQTDLGPRLKRVGAIAADFYLRTGYMPLASAHVQPRRSRVLFSDREIRALVAYVASLGPGPPIPRPHPERGTVADGLTLFTRHCAGCHQINAEGGYVTGGVAPPLEDATPVQIAEAIRVGPYLMPRFSKKQLGDGAVDSIIRYVQQTKHPEDRGGWAIGHIGPVPEGLVTWLIAIVALVATCLVIGKRHET